MRRQRILAALLIVIVLGLLAFIGSTVIGSVQDTTSREYQIVIPEGTGELIAQGKDPDIIPAQIELVIDEKDILVIENHDTVGHRISDFWVGSGETLRQQFKQEAVYQGECTVHENAQIEIIVTKKG